VKKRCWQLITLRYATVFAFALVIFWGLAPGTAGAQVRPITIGSLFPNTAAAGGPAFILTVNGSGYTSEAVVEWNGIPLSTRSISASQLAASVPASFIASPASTAPPQVSVAIGDLASNGMSFFVGIAGPRISSLNPSSTAVEVAAFTLIVNGSGFAGGDVVLWDGTPLKTTFNSTSQLTASVPAGFAAAPGTAQIAVIQPPTLSTVAATFQLNSNVVNFDVLPPTIASLSPTTATAGGPGFTLTVNGSGFASGAVVQWNGIPLSTSFVTAAQLTASVPANLIATAGTTQVTVFEATTTSASANPAGITSNSAPFTITVPPTITSLNPSAALTGGSAFILTVNGSGFASGAVVQWNGIPLSTSFVTAAQLTALVPANVIALAGPVQVNVVQSGTTSNSAPFTVIPTTVTSLNPNTAIAGGPAFTLTVNGSGFASGGVVQWNGTPLSTTFVNATQLTASAPANLIATAGTAQVTVMVPGLTYNFVTFAITAPPLTITSLSPSAAAAGGLAFILTVNGSGFASGAVVQWNGTPLSTTFVNAAQVTASVPANLIATAGTARVIVAQAGTTSNSAPFTITSPPTVISLNPNTATAGGPAFTLTVNGTGFASGAAVQWNGTPLSTTFVGAAQLTASVPANLIATAGIARVIVAQAGTTSNSAPFTITSPPTVTSLNPNTATAGGPAFTLTVNGSGFASGSVVQWNGTPLSTTFVGAAQLTASVPANLIATAGSAQATVVAPGLTFNSLPFTITVPTPTITFLSPSTATAGGPAFTLTVNGSGFANEAVVQWSGTPLSTTFVNATQLIASVPANLIANPGTVQVTVAQGVTSNPVILTIAPPPPAAQTSVFEVHIAAADGTPEITADTRSFVLQIGLTVAVAANVQPITSLLIDFIPAAPGRLTGATNTLDIQGLVDDFVSRTGLTSFHLEVPITVRGSLVDIAGAELAIVTKNSGTLPSCRADVGEGRIINDACRYGS
jgi:hypothetical protein